MDSSRLIHRVVPHEYEDIVGFLMRVASANRLLGPQEILCQIPHMSTKCVQVRNVPELAYFTKNTVEEIYQLSGIEKRESGELRSWHIAGEWVTKAVFTEFRGAKVCPACLEEVPFIRGLWSLSFYKACPFHNLKLLEVCPVCNRSLAWYRKSPYRCSCAFDLRNAFTLRPNQCELSCAKLIAYRSVRLSRLLVDLPLDLQQVERIANLSLDGLCKTFWFLGHCMNLIGNHGAGHGRRKPKADEFDTMVDNAFALLNGWPMSLGQALSSKLGSGGYLNSAVFESFLMPAQHYFQESLNEPELQFLAAAYEQQVYRLWCRLGNRRNRSSRDRQLIFEF